MNSFVMIFFELVGGVTRFLIVNAFYKITSKNKIKRLSYFLTDKSNVDLSNGYINGFIGFLMLSILIFLLVS